MDWYGVGIDERERVLRKKFLHPLEVCATLYMPFACLTYFHVSACLWLRHEATSSLVLSAERVGETVLYFDVRF